MSRPGDRSDDVRSQIRHALHELLLDKIRQDRYPSVTMMDAVEARIDEDQLRDYAEVLLEKVEADSFPSIDMLRRLAALA